ncbi:MAG: hypothetical protein M3Q23_05570 [Actinomycetota bacterium]|nr:hypothetical protein [Actinomycetota bacterium]
MGDVDGDGSVDQVTVHARRPTNRACRYWLSVRTSRGRFTTQLPTPPRNSTARDDYEMFLAPEGMFHLPGERGRLIYVRLGLGASGSHGTLYMVRGSSIRRLAFEGERWDSRYTGNIWFPQSAEYGDATGCISGAPRTVVQTSYQGRGATATYDVTRAFFRLEGQRFVLFRKRHLVVQDSRLGHFAELGGTPFHTCPGRIGMAGL